MTLVGTISVLTALAVFQELFNGLLISFVAMPLLCSQRVEKLSKWMRGGGARTDG